MILKQDEQRVVNGILYTGGMEVPELAKVKESDKIKVKKEVKDATIRKS